MAGSRKLSIEIIGDAKGLSKTFSEAEKGADGFSKNIDSADKSLGGFKQSIADADGAGGKLKAGWGSATDSIKANAGAMAIGAGTALVAFGVQAVGAFVDTSKAAVDMGAALGLSVEDASRWIAVADDFGIEAGALESAFGKVSKSLDSGKWEKYGVATRDAAGQLRGTNDIILDSLDMLGKITNETERAKVGNELFGKGYSNLAPLIGQTREEYEDMLGAVEKGQVVTEGEARKAERMRLAQDALSDALGEVTLAVGAQVAELAPYVEMLASVIGLIDKLPDGWLMSGVGASDIAQSDKAGKSLRSFREETVKAAAASEDFIETMVDAGFSVKAAENEYAKYITTLTAMNAMTGAASSGVVKLEVDTVALAAAQNRQGEAARTGTESTNRWTEGMSMAGESARLSAEKTRQFEDAVRAADDAYSALTGELSQQEAWLNVEDSMSRLWQTLNDTNASTRDQERALIGAKRELANYTMGLDGVPASKKTEILALIDQGKLTEARNALDVLDNPRDVWFNARLNTAAYIAQQQAIGKGYAGGTDNAVPGWHWVGEYGPELMRFNGGEQVLPHDESMRMSASSNSTMSMIAPTQPAGAYGTGTTIVQVMVGGSLIHQQDLIPMIADGLIDAVRRGVVQPGSFG